MSLYWMEVLVVIGMDCLLLIESLLAIDCFSAASLHCTRVVEIDAIGCHIFGCNAVATAAVAFIENVLLFIPSSSSI